MKKIGILISLVFFATQAGPLFAVMTSDSYIIVEDGFSAVETVTSTGGDFSLFDFSDTTPGSLSGDGGSLELHGGFYFPDATAFSMGVSPTTLSLGTLSQSAVSSDSLTITVNSESQSGYTVSISEDGNLRSGSNDIDDVADGSVTAGSEEYGIITTGGPGLLAQDTAISGSVNVMSNNVPVTGDAVDVDFRASIGSNSQAGSYAHSVTFTGTVNP